MSNLISKIFLMSIKIIAGICVLCFGYILFRMYFPTNNIIYKPLRGIIGFTLSFSLIILFVAINKYIFFRFSYIFHKIFFFKVSAMIVIATIVSGYLLAVKPAWDFKEVFDAALEIASHAPISNKIYFDIYPHNLYPVFILGSLSKIFGGLSLRILNIIFIDIGIITGYFITKSAFGIKTASMYILLCLMTLPLFLYAPIVYTDTASMPFIMLMTLLGFIILKDNKQSLKAKNIILCILTGFLAGLGFLFKANSLIAFLALFLTFSFKIINRNNLWAIAGYLVIMTISLIIFTHGIIFSVKDLYEPINEELKLPYEHWVMLGFAQNTEDGGPAGGYGCYNLSDYEFSTSFETFSKRRLSIKQIIKKRILQEDSLGLILKKAEWTWTDGTYYSLVKLRYDSYDSENILYRLFINTHSNKAFLVYIQTFHGAIIMMILISFCLTAVKLQKRHLKNYIYAMIFLLLVIFGSVLFFSIWETRSRYLYSIIPLLNITAAVGIRRLANISRRLRHKIFLWNFD